MIRIRRIYSTVLPSDRERVEQVKEIFRQNFAAVADYAEKLPDLLNMPQKFGYRTIVLVAESLSRKVNGFALLLHFTETDSFYLDYLAVRRDIRGGGIGGLLYEAAREHAHRAGARGLFMEVLPDDPEVVHDPAMLEENRRRLSFYEAYGARPIINTAYETPVGPHPAPYLVYDGIGRGKSLSKADCRKAMRLILERKYSHLVGPEYIKKVVESVKDDPVVLRPPRYVSDSEQRGEVTTNRLEKNFALITSPEEDNHNHHVREPGYVERPARIKALREAVQGLGLFDELRLTHFSEEPIRAVHDADFVSFLKAVCEKLNTDRPIYPYVFPIRRPERRPKDLPIRAGYYCIDTFTPLDRNAYRAARSAVDVALSGTDAILNGRRVAYALCRPPGHHAERRVFGGFCYFNNAAAAAHRLSAEGKVAVLDVDFHHGNGTQDIFYRRSDVLTISIHGHPNFAYPYFSGFADETGEGQGRGFNRNFPLPEDVTDDVYMATLDKALALIVRFDPAFLVVSLGFDQMKGDPTGSFPLTVKSIGQIGKRIGALDLPTLIVQEGGYSLRNLRRGASAFFRNLAAAMK